jgi:uncharacterized protein
MNRMAWKLHEFVMNQDFLPAITLPLNADEFAEMEALLDGLRSRDDATPRWEFCEGFMVALICCRRQIAPADYWPVLLAEVAMPTRFKTLWARRWDEILQALDQKITALDDPGAYQPQVKDALEGADASSFGQVWAQGFMFAVKSWPDDWSPSRNKAAIKWLSAALSYIVALTEDDKEPPTLSAYDDGEGPPTLSRHRMNVFSDALWSVYNLREMWRKLGPRIETVRQAATPGRNDPCPCHSGKKYKKCCG